MTVLSAQSIRQLCHNPHTRLNTKLELICPFTERGVINGRSYGLGPCTYDVRTNGNILLPVNQGRLAVTIEHFNLPHNVCGSVLDKSTHARVFVTAFNTHLDPGWCGYLTVELVNLGNSVVEWQHGDPLCQIKFEWLDEKTELPYRGKYQGQPAVPVGPINEG